MREEWQQLTWNIFHKISLYYDPTYKDYYITFFESFKKLIPCKICRNHYINFMDIYFYKSINNNNIFLWTIDLHNSINISNNKKTWSYDEAKEYYIKNNINFNLFIYIYILKNVYNKNELIQMIKTIPYIYYISSKKIELINFYKNFELNEDNLKNWLVTLIIHLKL